MMASIGRPALMAAIVAAAAVSTSSAAAAPPAHAGVRILSPANEAVVTTGKVRLALATRKARGLRVFVDGEDVTRRLKAAKARRTAVLRGRLVRPGARSITVRWRRAGGGRPRTIRRRFMVARRAPGLIAKRPAKPRVHTTSGIARLPLSVERGVSRLHARVNGRRVRVPHLGRHWPRTTLSLGARHGLRFGRNRVEVLAHHFRRARYDREAWTVVVRRTRPLAAGTAHSRGEAGGRAVRLDGRGANPSRPDGRLRFRWRIVRRPEGSRARLVDPASATPRLPVDVRGRYTLVQRIAEQDRRGRDIRTSSHRVTVLGDTNALPLGAKLDVSFSSLTGQGTLTVDDDPSGGLPASDCTKPGSAGARRCVYPLQDVYLKTYLVVLDATTLEPKAAPTVVGLCPSDAQLRGAIYPWADKNVIAILTSAAGRECKAGSATLVDTTQPFTYIFTPMSTPDLRIRSGWYSEAPPDDPEAAAIEGFFQKSWPVGAASVSEQYRFVPGSYVGFDTNCRGGTAANCTGQEPAGQNTMRVGDRQYTSQLSGGATDGFQVLVLDKTREPMLGTPRAFRTTAGGTAPDGTGLWDMSTLLQQAAKAAGVSTVMVQSIGRPTPTSPAAPNAWSSIAAALAQMGASQDVFLNLKESSWPRPDGTTGWYALVAAPDPACAPTSTDSCRSAAEASTSLTSEHGDLSGALGRNNTWQYAPVMNQAGGGANDDMLTLAYLPPSKWPYSEDVYRPVLDYLARYHDDAGDLRPLGGADCYDPGPAKDVRSSYCAYTTRWGDIHTDLGSSERNQGVCAHYPGAAVVKVDAATYAKVCDRISLETEWLDTVHDNMDKLRRTAFAEPTATSFLAARDMAKQVKEAIESGTPKADRNIALELLGLGGEAVEFFTAFSPLEEIAHMGEIVGAALLLSGESTSLLEGEGQGDSAISKPEIIDPAKIADELDVRLKGAAAAFDHSWSMLVADPAKLETAYRRFALPRGENGADSGIWKGVPDNLGQAQVLIQNGIRRWAAGLFMAATYDVWLVDTVQVAGPNARDVTAEDVHTLGCDHNSRSKSSWPPFYKMPATAAYYLRDQLGLTQPKYSPSGKPTPIPRYGSHMWVLARGKISTDFDGRYDHPYQFWPPANLLDQLFSPPEKGGYGWQRPWLFTSGERFTMHDATWTRQPVYLGGRCIWFADDRYPHEP